MAAAKKKTAKKASAKRKKTAKKKAPARKKTAKKKAPARKSARKAAKKKTARKKAPARKAAKKKTAKKAARKKAPARKAAKKKAPARKKTAKKKSRVKRKPNAAFMKAMMPSAALAAVIGGNPMPRTEVTKKIWAYIKRHDLQDSKNRRNINADDKLRPVFGGKRQVSMFEMTKHVNKHLS